MPITWRNVAGNTGAAAASYATGRASQSLDGVFDTLRNSLDGANQVREDNRQNTIGNNTTAYLDRLASFGSAEELEAAQAAGDLERFKQSFNGLYDRDAVRGTANKQIDTLNQRKDSAIAREDAQNTRLGERALSGIQGRIALNDFEGAETDLTKFGDILGLSNLGDDAARSLSSGRDAAYNKNRDRTEDARSDAQRNRRESIDSIISGAVGDIEAKAGAGEPVGMEVGEARQTILGNMGIDDLSGADRQYAVNSLDAALSPYTSVEPMDLASRATEDGLLASKYNMNENLLYEPEPADPILAVDTFMEARNVDPDARDEILSLMRDGFEVVNPQTQQKERIKPTAKMLMAMGDFDDFWFGASDEIDKGEVKKFLTNYAQSEGYRQDLEALERWKAEQSAVDYNRYTSQVFRPSNP